MYFDERQEPLGQGMGFHAVALVHRDRPLLLSTRQCMRPLQQQTIKKRMIPRALHTGQGWLVGDTAGATNLLLFFSRGS